MKPAKMVIKFESSQMKLVNSPSRELVTMASKISNSDEYAKLFPENIQKNLIYVSLISHTLNHINQNDCLILGDEGIGSYKTLVNCPLDVEHERTDIVGFCVRSFLSNMKNNKVLSEELAQEIIDNHGMVNVGAIFGVWTLNFPELESVFKDNFDENSSNFNRVKASFEYYFDKFDFFVSNGNGDYPDGEIVSGESDNAELLFNTLKINGGSGKIGPNRISLIPRQGMLGGVAITYSPANEYSDVLAKKDSDGVVAVDNSVESQENIEILSSDSVIKTGDTLMPKNEKEIIAEVVAVEPTKIDAAIEMTVDKTVADALKSELDKKITELNAQSSQVENLNKTVIELTSNLEKVTALAAQLQANFDKEIESRIAKEKDNLIAARMSKVEEIFEVNDSNRSMLVTEVSSLSEEDFNKKLVMYRSISANKVEITNEDSVKKVVEEVVAETVKSTPSVDIIAAAPSNTLQDEFSKAFGETKSFGYNF